MQEQPKPHSGPPPVLRGFLLKKEKKKKPKPGGEPELWGE